MEKKSTPKYMQNNFFIRNLMTNAIDLPRNFWLKKGEILLKQNGENLMAFVLAKEEEKWDVDQKILPFLKTCSLITFAPKLEGGGGRSILKKSDLGKDMKSFQVRIGRDEYPKTAKKKVEKYVIQYLNELKKLHGKYYKIIKENPFLETSLNYYYTSKSQFLYEQEGFINTMMSLEALFNEGEGDISYKLQKRCAFILGFSRLDSIGVFEQLKKLSRVRNAIVHGNEKIPKIENKYEEYTYAKFSLIIMFILCKNPRRRKWSKKDRKKLILNEIDRAMLNEKIRKSMEKEIKKRLEDFRLKVPRKFEGKTKGNLYRLFPW